MSNRYSSENQSGQSTEEKFKSVLETSYVEPDRPFSQKELKYLRDNLSTRMRLNNSIRCHHKKCNHFYLVKQNGRKEKEILDTKSQDVGNCSICWKLKRTPEYLCPTAKDILSIYYNNFYIEPKLLSHGIVHIENVFYTWLYEEFN